MDVFNKVTGGKPYTKEWKNLWNIQFTKIKKKASLIIME